jgi:hypothetical protein
MKNLFLKITLALTVLFGMNLQLISVSALDCGVKNLTPNEQIQCGSCQASGTTDCSPGGSSGTITDIIHSVINVLTILGGAAAVIMVIIGGFRYITSAGNPEQAKSARSTITYAIVGLVIIALAQIIVHFTLNTVDTTCVNGKTASGQKC